MALRAASAATSPSQSVRAPHVNAHAREITALYTEGELLGKGKQAHLLLRAIAGRMQAWQA